nr:serine/threonine protein kinase [Nakamurella deserti]
MGVGGTGTVWRAWDRDRSRFCAAKLLRQRDAGELLRFAREQAVRLTHPRVVSPYAWAADDGMVVIVSELIDGGSLQTLIGDYGPLAEGTVVAVLDQVLDALGAVHAAQLIHRDVKPGNLLLRSGNRLEVLLADFGLTIGVRDARLTQVGTVIGTPGYLPPEVLAGGVPPDVRHDLYAVGRLGLTLLAGGEVDDARPVLAAIADPVLRSALTALVATRPADRPAATEAARGLLAGARRDDVPHTRDGDPLTVLDQLPPLPPGWSPDAGPDRGPGREVRPVRDPGPDVPPEGGPGGEVRSGRGAGQEVRPVRDPGPDVPPDGGPGREVRPDQDQGHQVRPGPDAGRAAGSGHEGPRNPRTRVDAAVTDVVTARAEPAQRVPITTTTAGSTSPRTVASPARPPVNRRWWVLSGAAVAVGVLGMLVAALSTGSADRDPTAPGDDGTPASTAPVAPGTVEAGDPCSWQQVNPTGSPDGVALTCTVVDGSYVWTPG